MRISKKILAAFLAALMAISMMPFTALAATVEVNSVASFEDAVANANAGDTIELTGDIDFTTDAKYPAPTEAGNTDKVESCLIELNDVTVNLNGHTITNNSCGAFFSCNNATIKNGNIVSVPDSFGREYGLALWSVAYFTDDENDICNNVVLEDLDVTGAINVLGHRNVVLRNCNVHGADKYYAVYLNWGADVTIESGSYTANTDNVLGNANYASYGEMYASNLKVTGGDFEVKKNLVLPSSGPVAVSGGTFTKSGAAYTVPSNWLAEGATQENGVVTQTYVAKIGDVKYETLAAAIAAAQNGETVTLLSDVAVDSTIVLNDGRNITIDTNGKTISSTKRVFEIRHGGVTLTGDGTVSTTAVSAVAVYGSTDSTDADYATFTLGADTTISAPNGYGAMIGANNKAAYGAKLTLNGTINSLYGVYVNGNVQEPADKTNAAQVTINGTVTAGNEDAAVYAAGYAKWAVNAGSTVSGGSGIYIKSGDLAVNGGTITATGAKTAYTFNTNGANGTGDAIIIDSCGYPGNVPTVTINAGTISSTSGDAVASYTKQDDSRYPDADYEKVTNVIPSTSTAVFSGDVSELAAEGYVTKYDETSGGYVVAVDTAVAKVGDVKYDTLAEAVNAFDVSEGGTITLLSDVNITTPVTIQQKGKATTPLVFDLNGHSITSTASNGYALYSAYSNIELKNGDVNGAIAVYGANGFPTGSFTVKIDADATVNSTKLAAVNVFAVSSSADGVVLDVYGKITSTKNAAITVNGQITDTEGGILTVNVQNGAVVECTDATGAGIYAAGYANYNIYGTVKGATGIYQKGGNLTVYDGAVVNATGADTDPVENGNGYTSTGEAITVENTTTHPYGSTVISGGTITSANADAVGSYALAKATAAGKEAVAEIIPSTSKAVFSSDVSALAEEGFVTNYDAEKGGYVIGDAAKEDMMSITVDEAVDLNIYLANEDGMIDKVYTYYNRTPDTETNVSNGETIDAVTKDGYVVIKIKLAPAQIKDQINIVPIKANGDYMNDRAVNTSVADYCKAIINGEFDAKLKDLAKATLDYGKAAANYFDYNASAYTDANYLDAPVFDASDYVSNVADLPINSVSYVAKSVPELRFYIDANTDYFNESVAEMMNTSIKSNIGKARFVKLEGTNQIILQIKNIPITDFGKQIRVTVNSGADDMTILGYTPIKWVIAAQSLGGDLGTLADGIGNYYAKSVAYFEA